ncbi:ROK family protein [Paractinoplanes durhamensis]|uniref:Glucokinase n=1 Tax=Paractinoplanes durhamensis TaxID=113563 RepID=A0ABQ3YTU4_9ACTN|nr:ROK family protein [Actinoplanes durhamensis]GIE00940.1 glucokinase [Actinoplanes durhamensis]
MDQAEPVRTPASWVVVGLDNGGTCNNATVLDATGQYLVDHLVENPSLVTDGPESAVEALAEAFANILDLTRTPLTLVRAVGLDTPGPASATGVISSKGATNFSMVSWHGFDIRGALEARLGLPVFYHNDANAAALYAHHQLFGNDAMQRSSVAAIVGTGLGGGVVENGRVISGAAGMAGELGHVQIPLHGVLEDDQPVPQCNCGFAGDGESLASLTGIKNNLLPYWLSKFPDHPLAAEPIAKAAKLLRGYGEKEDPLALAVFGQQAKAIGKLFTIAANFTDPHAYLLGGGVVEAEPKFRQWFLNTVREHTQLRQEQQAAATFALVADLDMAGARGAAVAALEGVQQRRSTDGR